MISWYQSLQVNTTRMYCCCVGDKVLSSLNSTKMPTPASLRGNVHLWTKTAWFTKWQRFHRFQQSHVSGSSSMHQQPFLALYQCVLFACSERFPEPSCNYFYLRSASEKGPWFQNLAWISTKALKSLATEASVMNSLSYRSFSDAVIISWGKDNKLRVNIWTCDQAGRRDWGGEERLWLYPWYVSNAADIKQI